MSLCGLVEPYLRQSHHRGAPQREARITPGPVVPVPTEPTVSSAALPVDVATVGDLLDRADALVQDLLRQNLVLRAERDEARAALDRAVQQRSTALMVQDARLCTKCPRQFIPLGAERVCPACHRETRKRIAILANAKRKRKVA